MLEQASRDQNGNRLTRDVRREYSECTGIEGWGVTVWFGGCNGFATNAERRIYTTRAQARDADISCIGDGLIERCIL